MGWLFYNKPAIGWKGQTMANTINMVEIEKPQMDFLFHRGDASIPCFKCPNHKQGKLVSIAGNTGRHATTYETPCEICKNGSMFGKTIEELN